MQDTTLPQLTTLARAAEALGVSKDALRAWQARGAIRLVRTPGGRWLAPVEELRRIVREGMAGGGTG